VKGQEVVEYYHRGVVFYLVGFPLAIPLDVEMLQPGRRGTDRGTASLTPSGQVLWPAL